MQVPKMKFIRYDYQGLSTQWLDSYRYRDFPSHSTWWDTNMQFVVRISV